MRTNNLIVCLVLAAAVVAAGCARKRGLVVPGGRVTVTEKGGKAKSVEVKTKGGTATIEVEKKTITEAELGAPVYPGATVEVSGTYEGTGGGQAEKTQQHMLTTPDDFDKVFEFYKSRLKNVKNTFNQTAADNKMAMFSATSADGSAISLHIIADKEKKVTRIQVITVQKPKQ